jgi:lipoprotein signal peptidase
MKPQRSYRWLLWTLALLGLALDQAGKYGVFRALYDEALDSSLHQATSGQLPPPIEQTVIPGALEFYVQYTYKKWDADACPLRTWSGEHQPHINRGAFLGLGGGGGGGPDGNLVFAVVSVLAAAAIIWWSTRRSIAHDRLLCIALGLILGGTLGNLYDRIVFDGVRDYLYWSFILKTAVFNIADFMLICGALLLLFQAFVGKPAKEEKPAAAAAAAGTAALTG